MPRPLCECSATVLEAVDLPNGRARFRCRRCKQTRYVHGDDAFISAMFISALGSLREEIAALKAQLAQAPCTRCRGTGKMLTPPVPHGSDGAAISDIVPCPLCDGTGNLGKVKDA